MASDDDGPMQALWTAQCADGAGFDVERIRERAHRFQRRVFRRNAVEYAAAALVVAIFAAMVIDRTFMPVMRIGAALSVAAAVYVAWQLHRRTSTRAVSAEAFGDDCIAFHRRELERQRDALANVGRWYLSPFVPGLLVFFVGVPIATGRGWLFAAACVGVTGVLYFAVAKANHAAARHLQRQIDALDEATHPR